MAKYLIIATMLTACTSTSGGQPPAEPYLGIQILSIDVAGRTVTAQAQNTTGQTLLVPECIGGVQVKVGEEWKWVDDGRTCPMDSYRTFAPNEIDTLKFTLPQESSECEYRIFAEAALTSSNGEPALIQEQLRPNTSQIFCFQK